ncbi:MAG: hypothetical protein ACRC2H_01150 [Silanimonas sp.]
MTTNTGGPATEGRAMTLPELPALRQFDIGKQGAYNDSEGPYCDVQEVEARERILVAEIERLRAEASAPTISLAEHVRRMVVDAGSYRELEKRTGVDHVYLYRMVKDRQRNPSNEVLSKLGLEVRVTATYTKKTEPK